MPLRIILFYTFLFCLALGVSLVLLRYVYASTAARRFRAAVGVSALLLAWLGVGSLLASLFIPCFPLFASPVCRGPRAERQLALTFDDGPHEPYTSRILDTLARYHIHATFFLVGERMNRYPEVVARMLRDGHAVGNHSWDHRSFAFASSRDIERDITRWESAIAPLLERAGAKRTTLFRAPHGWKSPCLGKVLAARGYRLIGWTHGVWDSDRPGEDVLLRRLKAVPENGAIILLHDGDGDSAAADRGQTAAVLPQVIDYYQSLGFRFVTVPKLL